MTWILGPGGGRLGYSFFGDWTRVVDLYISVPEVVAALGDVVGEIQPGTFAVGEDYVFGRLELGVE